MIEIDERGQSGEVETLRQSSRLGDLPLRLLPVAHENIDAPGRTTAALRQRVADPGGQPLPEISASPVYPGNRPLDMPLERAAACAKVRRSLFRIEEAEFAEHRVRRRGGMSMADDDIIPIRRPGRSDVRCRVGHQRHLKTGKGTCGVSALRAGRHRQNAPSATIRNVAVDADVLFRQRFDRKIAKRGYLFLHRSNLLPEEQCPVL